MTLDLIASVLFISLNLSFLLRNPLADCFVGVFWLSLLLSLAKNAADLSNCENILIKTADKVRLLSVKLVLLASKVTSRTVKSAYNAGSLASVALVARIIAPSIAVKSNKAAIKNKKQ